MSEKRKWAKVKPGDIVTLGGRDWTVEKIKPKGKRLKVAVRSGSHRAESLVDPAEKVKIGEAKAAPPARKKSKPTPPPPVRPPKPAEGDPWETQQDRIEKQLGQILGAHLVGESIEGVPDSFYVPPVDVTTIAAHLAIFHGGVPTGAGEEAMMIHHAAEHAAVEAGEQTLPRNHWHTEKRPTKSKKKGKK